MKTYTLTELGVPETYAADPALATLARRAAEASWSADHGVSRGDWKRGHLSGAHAQSVLDAVEAQLAAEGATQAKADKALAVAQTLQLPEGWSSAIEGDQIILRCPYLESLPSRLRKLDADWDADVRVWRVPLAKAASLKRVIVNAAAYTTSDAALAKQRVKACAERERWLIWVEEKAPEGYVYERGVEELRRLSLADYPELSQRLDAAIRLAAKIKTERTAARQRDRVEHDAGQQREREARARAQTGGRRLFPTVCSPRLETTVRFGDRAVVYTGAGSRFRIDEDHPSIHGSHLLGYEGEWGAYYYYRDATADETAVLVAWEARSAAEVSARQEREIRIRALAERIEREGEWPTGPIIVGGVRYAGAPDVYGGGAWFELTDTHVWWIRNNGLDGDNWSRNNVATGGAGAVGYCLARTPELVAQLEGIG